MQGRFFIGITIFCLGITLLGCQSIQKYEQVPTIQVATILPGIITSTLRPVETKEKISTETKVQIETDPTSPPNLLNVEVFPDPTKYSWNLIASGFSRPLGFAAIDDSSNILYILEQEGVIRVISDGAISSELFLDLRDRVGSRQNEQGLLGIALDPGYMENRIFYLNYTNKSGNTTISRFVANEDFLSANPASEHVILTQDQPYANHNGGNIVFGPDGFLYIGLGDGGSGGDPQGNAQNKDTLLGKMLRIAVTDQEGYAIPSDNPFAGGGGRGEIWAIGLRNPWRYSFDRSTGDLYNADVGQGDWEEINFLPNTAAPGANFGWDYREGSHPFEGTPPGTLEFIDPISEYDHSQGCSVTGGFVYRGRDLPEWNGIYLFGDYCSGNIWGLIQKSNGGWDLKLLFETKENISSFGEDFYGEIYMISHSGSIFKLEKTMTTLGYLPLIRN
ncbi:MAG: glucose dehydrogenase [Chloroflexi bacterium HGW-Chloroflexi-8]|nr:MAG: glucose dehydrogenase [Chloroflexi bacterium HGW-Chloroflexi-8]